ncbi:MAG: hypothetical protein IJ105_05840 [Bacilli bacterium]|nr:hypothetical protein [Bacilli bacterium]
MKKLFGEIDLTWKKLIIFAIITAIYTATMAILPITADTSFRDIAATFEWWILFGVIIISNSKSPKDSALKCFVFFLISQPLIYLLQVPFSWQGWHLFSFYKYWFIWTIACLPMGYIGYYIKKDNILSVIILLPILILLSIIGIGFFSSTIENFPHHLLSGIFCFTAIILIILGVLNKKKNKIISFAIIILFTIGYVLISNGILFGTYKQYEVYEDLKEYNITLSDEYYVSGFFSTEQGSVEIIEKDGKYVLKITGIKNITYKFGIASEDDKQLRFEYHFDDDRKLVLEQVNEYN